MLFHMLTQTAEANADKTALVYGNIRLSYAQLFVRVERFVEILRVLKVDDGDCVILMLPNSIEYIVSFFAVAGLGSIVLPLHPALKADELRHYLIDNEVKAIITDSERAEKCRQTARELDKDVSFVIVDEVEKVPDPPFQQQASNKKRGAPRALFDGPVVCQHSSGSTGRAKKVYRTQKNLVYEIEAYTSAIRMTAADTVLCIVPLFHTHGMMKCMLASLTTGVTLVLLEQVERNKTQVEVPFVFRARHVLELIAQEHISILPATPYIFGALAEVPKDVNADLSSLRLCLTGGNFLPQETFTRFKQRFGILLRSMYGSTEAGLITVNMEPDEDVRHDMVGRPIGTIEVRVTNGTLESLPAGSVGEIVVKSEAMTAGYLNNDELNREAFREGFFFTGDLGKKDEKGRLFITGRKKIFIESGGEKVDPLEIEQVLLTHPAVREVAVVGIPGPYGGQSIKAVIVAEGMPTELEVLLYCKDRLSDYKIPHVVEFRDALPRSPLGKILRKDLLDEQARVEGMDISSPEDRAIRSRILASLSDEESVVQFLVLRMRQQIAAFLHVDVAEIDTQRPLGEFGLGSLMAVELRNWLQASLELPFPITLFWSYPTIESLAAHLVTRLLQTVHAQAAVRIEKGHVLESTVKSDESNTTHHALQSSEQPAETEAKQGNACHTMEHFQVGLEALKRERTEPIAIIGMSCRFPGGANSPEAFWRLLIEGRDAITEVPSNRYDIDTFYDPDIEAPGKTVSRWGGFLDAIDQFDPMFFGISPREAAYLDPQQRLLLEVSWEAMERAGLRPEKLFGSQTGVFTGLFNRDYFDMQIEQMVYENAASANAYIGIGNGPSFAAGRISYLLGLQGPSMVVDTVCSSSLVAVHLACQSLYNKECTMAFAGATNLILYPLSTIITSKMRVLSSTGRSKAFDASADGFVRGEGCAVVILKRLSQAQADGDPILALIRGSAVNQDGRSSGLTAPNGMAQQDVVRQALQRAGVAPRDISYVETHGTGTALGDPIEVEALKAVVGQPRPVGPECVLGSVKTNIGHLEACAGMAGLIKAVLCMQHGMLPPVLHLKELNPHISLENTPFVIPTSLRSWPQGIKRKYAGVSGAGLSGTNAHVVLEEAPDSGLIPNGVARDEIERTSHILPLSARDPEALRQLARTYQHELVTPESLLSRASLRDICYTASVRRTHYPYRIALVGQDHEGLASQLEALTENERVPITVSEAVGESKPDPVFMFAGQGTQRVGVGRQLFEQEPVFRASIEECDALLRQYISWSLVEEFYADSKHSRLHKTQVAQVVLFAMQVALVALWRSWGIVPGAVIGHSVGEIAAAYVAGVLSLEDAVKIVAYRGQLMQQAHGQGKMAVVVMEEAEVRQLVAAYASFLSIAAVNSPTNIVLSGETKDLEEVLHMIEREGTFFRRLPVDYAFHSRQMELFRQPLVQRLQGLKPRKASIQLVSTVTGQCSSGEEYGADYWGRNMCQEVRFGPALEKLMMMGYRTFLEISSQPALLQSTKQCLKWQAKDGMVLPSLRQGMEDRAVILASLGALYIQGYTVDWERVYRTASETYTVVTLPTYQWQRKRYWFPEKKSAPPRYRGVSSKAQLHPLLGQHLRSATKEKVFETVINASVITWLNDHQIYDTVVFPASACIEMMVAGAKETLKVDNVQLDDLFIHQALQLSPDTGRLVQLLVHLSADRKSASVQMYSSVEDEGSDDEQWVLHASGNVQVAHYQATPTKELFTPTDVQLRCLQRLEGHQHYQHMRDIGLQYGTTFQGVRHIWRRDGEALASIILPEQLENELNGYTFHPALLDACFQVVESSLAKSVREHEMSVYLPLSMDSIRLYGRPQKSIWCHVVVRPESEETGATPVVDVQILDESGQSIGEINGLHLRRAPREALIPQARQQIRDWFYTLNWERKERVVHSGNFTMRTSAEDGTWLILGDRSGTGSELARRLRMQGEQCVLVLAKQEIANSEFEADCIDPFDPAAFHALLAKHFPDGHTCRGIVHLWSLDCAQNPKASSADLEESQHLICGSVLHMIQALVGKKWSSLPQLWIMTRSSQSVTGGESELTIAQAPIWGLGRVIVMEQPDFHCTRIDLDCVGNTYKEIDKLLEEIEHPENEDQIAFRLQERYVARLEQSDLGSSGRRQQQRVTPSFRADSTYLITGGSGGLGLALARWIVIHGGVKHLVLASRSGASHATRVVTSELEQKGAKVLVINVDVSQENQVAQMLATVRSTMPSLRGIIHAAGVLDDGVLLQQNWERFNKVMAPKLKGTWNLHMLTQDMPLDFFTLFSSGASLLGSTGQGNYAAANAFMDGLAHYRRLRGLPAVSINWGAWSEAGMATTSTQIQRQLVKDGMQPIGLVQGMEILEQVLEQSPVQIGVLPIDWTKFVQHFMGSEKPAFLERLLNGVHVESNGTSLRAQQDTLLRTMKAVPESEQLDILRGVVRQQIRLVLGFDAGFKLEPEQNLFEVGMDSLMAVELRNRLHALLGTLLPASLVFDHPNAEALTTYLAKAMLHTAEWQELSVTEKG